MKRIFLTIQYDGANYCGWQKQKNFSSVQGEVERAVFELTDENVSVEGSGRTDAGVSALAQVAHFDTNSKIAPKRFAKALNTKLPNDIAILSSKASKKHARFDAKKKTYKYEVYVSDVRLPLFDRTMSRVTSPLDLKKVQEEAKAFIGKRNFKAFCSSETQVKDFVREVFDFKVSKKQNIYTFEVTGSGFLYNMVRIMVGTLVKIGSSREQVMSVEEIIKSEDRTKAGKTMPAKGLMLKKVVY